MVPNIRLPATGMLKNVTTDFVFLVPITYYTLYHFPANMQLAWVHYADPLHMQLK